MHRSPGLLVSLISRIQEQSDYESEPNEFKLQLVSYELCGEQALIARYTALENAVADMVDSE